MNAWETDPTCDPPAVFVPAFSPEQASAIRRRFLTGDCEEDCMEQCQGPCGVLP